MSQAIRRMVAAASLTAALLMAVPAASQAAQVRKPAPGHGLGLVAQVWSWLEEWMGLQPASPALPRKTGTTTTQTLPPQPPPPEQGPAIDPNGVK